MHQVYNCFHLLLLLHFLLLLPLLPLLLLLLLLHHHLVLLLHLLLLLLQEEEGTEGDRRCGMDTQTWYSTSHAMLVPPWPNSRILRMSITLKRLSSGTSSVVCRRKRLTRCLRTLSGGESPDKYGESGRQILYRTRTYPRKFSTPSSATSATTPARSAGTRMRLSSRYSVTAASPTPFPPALWTSYELGEGPVREGGFFPCLVPPRGPQAVLHVPPISSPIPCTHGVRTCAPFEEGIVHSWMGGLGACPLAGQWSGSGGRGGEGEGQLPRPKACPPPPPPTHQPVSGLAVA